MKHPVAIFVIGICLTAAIARAEQEGPYGYEVEDGNAIITGFDQGYSGDLTITNILGGYPVTSIGDYAFYGCYSLTSLAIPDSITSIGDYAFSYCSSLTNIAVNSENSFFADVDGVLFDKSATVLIQYPGGIYGAYTIPDGVTSIGYVAFYGCSSLTSLVIPDSVTSIGDWAFSGCSNLTNVAIPASIVSIGVGAFEDCSSLTSVDIPNSVTSISGWAFSGCSSLTSATIPDSVTSIGDLAFESCSSLTSIIIPDGVTSIGYSAFSGCSGLASVVIPASVTNIGWSAFYGCSSLARVYFDGDAPAIDDAVYWNLFGDTGPAVIYYLPDTDGWEEVPYTALLWNPTFPAIARENSDTVSCVVTGTPNIPIAIQMRTNLLSGAWETVVTLTNLDEVGAYNFADIPPPDAGQRFYRIAGP